MKNLRGPFRALEWTRAIRETRLNRERKKPFYPKYRLTTRHEF